MGALQAHLINSISLNIARKPIYAELSSGKSLPLSRNLILATRSIVPFAKRLDKHGNRLNRMGIPILREDLVPIHGLPGPETAPLYREVIPRNEASRLKKQMKEWAVEIKALRKENQLREICTMSSDMLQEINSWEENHGCHFAMTKYLLGSMAYTALRGITYMQYENRSLKLSARLIKGHLFLIPWAIPFDRKAQNIQSMGVGFLVNDLPEIPFLSEWKKNKNKSWSK